MTASSKPLKDPAGGLTAAGRAKFRATQGARLRPGVTKPDAEMTPEDMKRKGSFLRRHFANPRGSMQDEHGAPTRLALSAHAWGEPVPKDEADARRLADKGSRYLQDYHRSKAASDDKPSRAAAPRRDKRA